MRVPAPTCLAATSLGELKNTIESRNALSISATATASTPSEPPIRTRRLCLRVIGPLSFPSSSSFETETFDEIVDALDLVGPARQCPLGIGGGGLRLIAVAEHRVGAYEPQPAI